MEELINKDWTWDEAFTAYKNELVFNEHSEDAIKVRLIVLNAFANLAKQKDLLPADVSKLTVKEFFTSRNIKTNTKASQTAYLNHFFDFLVESFVTLDNIVAQIKTPKIKTTERVILNENEIEQVYNFVQGHKRSSISVRDSIIIDLLLVPALRVKELANLKIKDLFLNELKIKVVRKGGKEQFLPIRKNTAEQIQVMLDQRDSCLSDEHLFLSTRMNSQTGEYPPLAKRTIQDNIHKYLITNCDDNKTNFGPHLLRHTGATQMMKNGGDVVTLKEILGHEDLNTTMIYTHTNFDDMNKVVQSIKRPGTE
jgi:integrase/recombinase XerC